MRWYIVYRSKTDHDCCTVWTTADSKEEAIRNVKSEYWDIEEIIDVYKGKR